MKKVTILLLILTGLIISFIISCESNTKSRNNEILSLNSEQLPCHTVLDEQQQLDNDNIINYNYENGILELIINFKNTCGSAYSDSLVLYDNEINIFLNDTSCTHYRCICNHQSIYEFDINDYSKIDINLYINAYGLDEYSVLCDTTLNL